MYAHKCGVHLTPVMQAASPLPRQHPPPASVLHAGGYMRTGTGTGEEVSHESPRFFVTGSCGQIGRDQVGTQSRLHY